MKWLDSLIAECLRPAGTIVAKDQDEYGNLLVIDQSDRRILTFDSPFEQSCMRLGQPYFLTHEYTQFMILALAFIQPGHVTLLGLGGGSLLRTLHHLLPKCFFTAVELREKVFALAKEYFAIPVDYRVSVIVDDAMKAMSLGASGSTDIIFSDIYDAYRMDQIQRQHAFLEECARMLSPDGWLVMNFHKLPEHDGEFYASLHSIFSSVMLCLNDGNVVLYANKKSNPSRAADLLRIEHIENSIGQKIRPLLCRVTQLADAQEILR